MSQKSPLEVVNDDFGGKDKLVEKLVGLLESDESKEDLRKRLLGVANKKLLRLHRVASAVREQYGSRDKLLEKTVTTIGRAKDKDFHTRLESMSTSRLLDMAHVAERRHKAASAPPKPKAPKPVRKAAPKAAPKAKATARKPAAKRGRPASKGSRR
jgi:hypothetical protein